MKIINKLTVAAALLALSAGAASAAPTCHLGYGSVNSAKPNKLYVYMPPADDATYPEFGIPGATPNTSPAHKFDASELTNYTGTTAALRDRIYDVVADTYCEFDVQVIETTVAPPTTFARRNTVEIGSDSAPGGLFGLAQAIDAGDSTPVDFARVWAGTYQVEYGSAGGALQGGNSTLDRWARSIGGTASHEAGHNYGLSHNDGLPLAPGEDVLTHHIMASGSHYSGEQRAGYRRHFSDHEYSLLAANVGLSVQTVYNWDFINPNMQTGYKLRITFLSTQPSAAVSWDYQGALSPWISPTVSGPMGTQVFKGVTYNVFQITWSSSHAWNGDIPGASGAGTPGQVGGGMGFHVGAGFTGVDYNTPDPIIVTDVALLDTMNNPLALHPRALAFDAGTIDAADGTMAVNAFNFGAPLLIQNVQVQLLPRLLSIDSMVRNGKPVDVMGQPFVPWRGGVRTILKQAPVTRERGLALPIARLSQGRHVVQIVTEKDCAIQDALKGPDVTKCHPGMSVELFPSTTFLVTATVIDPSAKYWSPRLKRYVVGPLINQVFYQVAGRHPDLNKNGVDDYIDIALGREKDFNHDGVPDEVQHGRIKGEVQRVTPKG